MQQQPADQPGQLPGPPPWYVAGHGSHRVRPAASTVCGGQQNGQICHNSAVVSSGHKPQRNSLGHIVNGQSHSGPQNMIGQPNGAPSNVIGQSDGPRYTISQPTSNGRVIGQKAGVTSNLIGPPVVRNSADLHNLSQVG